MRAGSCLKRIQEPRANREQTTPVRALKIRWSRENGSAEAERIRSNDSVLSRTREHTGSPWRHNLIVKDWFRVVGVVFEPR